MKNLLPIGSIVRLKGGKKNLMIIGTLAQRENGEQFDYVAVVHPEGFIDAETFFMFNNENIDNIEFVGYINGETQIYMAQLTQHLSK